MLVYCKNIYIERRYGMIKDEVFSQVKELLLEVLEKRNNKEIIEKTALSDLGLDSITTISLIILIEEHFNIELDDEDLLFENYSSVERITQMIERYV